MNKTTAYKKRRLLSLQETIATQQQHIHQLSSRIQELEEELKLVQDTRVIMKAKPKKKRRTSEDERAKRWNLMHK